MLIAGLAVVFKYLVQVIHCMIELDSLLLSFLKAVQEQ